MSKNRKAEVEAAQKTLDLKNKKYQLELDTSMGKILLDMLPEVAPGHVANILGLAKIGYYDGLGFHRIIKGFMIQGGDPKGIGSGEPGYVIPDEIWENALHDRAGLLCMANRGPNTNGAQFFITDALAKHLDGGYTIFGECGPEEAVHKLASVEVQGERPKSPPKMKVKIHRAEK